MNARKRSNAPQWLKLRDEALSSIGRLEGPISDLKTYKVMINVTKVLMSDSLLPDKMKQTFIENIRRRTRRARFAYEGPLQMTPNQRKHARKTGADALPSFEELLARNKVEPISDVTQDGTDGRPLGGLQIETEGEVQGEVGSEEALLLLALQRFFIHLSTEFHPDFTLLSSILGEKPTQSLEFWARNGMKEKEINHEPDMICASPDMRLAGSPDVHDLPRTSHEPAAPGNVHARTNSYEHEQLEDRAQEATSTEAMDRRREIIISYFHHSPKRAPSAMLQIDEMRHALVFSSADVAEEKIHKSSEQDWWDAVKNDVLAPVRAASRKAGQTVQRFVLSPIYAAKDTFGLAEITEANAMAILRWDATGQPCAVDLIVGEKTIHIPLQPHHSQKPKAPTHKGHLTLEA